MRSLIAGLFLLATVPFAQAETTECLEITSLPAVITTQGIHCFKQDLSRNATTGNAIEIQVNNVTIDLNGYKLGGLGAGTATEANGIYGTGLKNIVIKNGVIRGFAHGIDFEGPSSTGLVIEDMLLDQNRIRAIYIRGSGNIIRNNQIVSTGGSPTVSPQAIFLRDITGAVVESNLITKTDGTPASGSADVITLSSASMVRIANNVIHETIGTLGTNGINIGFNSDNVTILENEITNPSADPIDEAVNDSQSTASAVRCIRNVAGYATAAFTECDVDQGNLSFP